MKAEMDRVCVVVGRTRHKMVAAELRAAADRGAKLVELRLDFLAKAVDYKRLMEHKACDLVATLRRSADGGRWAGSEEDRLMVMRQAIASGGFEWVDLEHDVIDSIPRFGSVKRIVSYHNFEGLPSDLEQIHAAMCEKDVDVVKIAVAATRPADNLRVLNLHKSAKKPTVAFCMGEVGVPSRVLALKFGAPFIYAAFNKERNVAPGIPSFDEVRRIYPVDTINEHTKVYGVVGDPVGHSLSPLLHNRLFKAAKVNAVYVPFLVPRGQFGQFLAANEKLPADGYSVTIPHKEVAADKAAERDEAVNLIGAANTLVRTDDGFRAANTDYSAILDILDDEGADDLRGRPALILGAGGVARAAAHALRRRGAAVTVCGRTKPRAESLAAQVEGKAVDWTARHNVNCELLVNCTPVGMHPDVDDSPVHFSFLRPELLVFDTVYTPENTKLLNDARNRGCRTVSGLEMFVRQAALQFKMFAGMDPPMGAMRELVRKAISPLAGRMLDAGEGDL